MTRRQALTALRRSLSVTAILTLHHAVNRSPAFSAEADPSVSRKPAGVDMDQATTNRRSANPYRLPRHVVPIRYELKLEPDLTTFTFAGTETVTLTILEATSEIICNAVELQI